MENHIVPKRKSADTDQQLADLVRPWADPATWQARYHGRVLITRGNGRPEVQQEWRLKEPIKELDVIRQRVELEQPALLELVPICPKVVDARDALYRLAAMMQGLLGKLLACLGADKHRGFVPTARQNEILDFLKTGPKLLKEIAEHLGIDEPHTSREIKPLKIAGLVIRRPGLGFMLATA